MSVCKRSGLSAFILALLLACAPAARVQAAARVLAAEAANQAGADSFVTQGALWTYPTSAIPVRIMAARAPERAVWFDPQAVRMLFLGADAHLPCEIELTFLSDAAGRAVAVAAGPCLLEKSLELPARRIATRRYAVPAAAIRHGELSLEVRRLAGPNAVVSSVRITSPDPAAKPLSPYTPPPLALPAIRLTPRPATVAGVRATSLSLNGTWQFNPAPRGEFWKSAQSDSAWKPIAVPGEWTMQGFTVTSGTAAAYRRAFTLPADWAGRRVKLRFDGVYSEARVWVNGREAGAHQGGFTPFELDVTGLARPGGENELALAVASLGTRADRLASGSRYAQHDLGGITRKVTLWAVPEVNLARLHAATLLDRQYQDATLELALEVANEGPAPQKDLNVTFALADPAGQPVASAPPPLRIDQLAASATLARSVRIPVRQPRLWDSEHPNLYRLACTLGAGGRPLETVMLNVGFRQVEVRGNELLLNGRAIKLRGVCHHETHPALGRALTPALWEQDARLFLEGNVNYVRTSHYPPAEEFLDGCDRLGLLVESEAPLCWAPASWIPGSSVASDDAVRDYVRPTLEMVEFNRNHPSVIIWSLGNESSKWRENFSQSAAAVRQVDPTRPRNFSGSDDAGKLELAGPHYPGLKGPARFANAPRPTVFDEYIHLNCYNHEELVTDPGLRDFWGAGSAVMWEKMRASRGTLGGAIWAALDDTFFLPGGRVVGYGPWGPLDGWRRPKPEYWHMKKFYSPLRIAEYGLPWPAAGQPLRLAVENRHDFADLNEVRFEWSMDGKRGVATASAPPQTTGTLEIGLGADELKDGGTLALKALDPRGFIIDEWRLAAHPPQGAPAPIAATGASGTPTISRGREQIVAAAPDCRLVFDGRTGLLREARAGNKVLLTGGPSLMLLPVQPPHKEDTQLGGSRDFAPFTATCASWQPRRVEAGRAGDGVYVRSEGDYKEARGAFTTRLRGDGRVTVEYDFVVKEKVNPRQIGLVLDLPRALDTLFWRRNAQWSAYPADHIGRPLGSAPAFYAGVPRCGLAGPGAQPAWPWSHDANELGSNDFRSTKLNILEGGLRDGQGAGVRVESGGVQHLRAWVAGESIRLLIADYANEGGASFFTEHVTAPRPLAPGDRVRGAATFCLLPAGLEKKCQNPESD